MPRASFPIPTLRHQTSSLPHSAPALLDTPHRGCTYLSYERCQARQCNDLITSHRLETAPCELAYQCHILTHRGHIGKCISPLRSLSSGNICWRSNFHYASLFCTISQAPRTLCLHSTLRSGFTSDNNADQLRLSGSVRCSRNSR